MTGVQSGVGEDSGTGLSGADRSPRDKTPFYLFSTRGTVIRGVGAEYETSRPVKGHPHVKPVSLRRSLVFTMGTLVLTTHFDELVRPVLILGTRLGWTCEHGTLRPRPLVTGSERVSRGREEGRFDFPGVGPGHVHVQYI